MHANIDGQIDHYDHFRQHHTVRLDRSLPLSLCLYLCNFFSHRKENERIVAEKKKKKWISTEREKNMAKNNISLKWLSNRSDCEEITKAFNRLFIIVLFEHAPRQ